MFMGDPSLGLRASRQGMPRQHLDSDERTVWRLWRQGHLDHAIPETPTPTMVAHNNPPLDVGEHILERTFRRFLAPIDTVERQRIAAWARAALNSKLSLATACSGTEQPVLVFAALGRVLEVDLGVRLDVASAFACESDSSKQAMIRMLFPRTARLFRDARDLGDEQALEEMTECLVAGFPCTDASRLNAAATGQEDLTCVLSSGLRTGSVYRGLLKCVSSCKHSLRFAAFENVATLSAPARKDGTAAGPSKLQACIGLLNAHGFYSKAFLLCPTFFVVPQQRQRIYFPAVPMSRLESSGITPKEAGGVLSGAMSRFVGSRAQELSAYLLNEQDDIIRSRYMRLLERRRDSDTQQHASGRRRGAPKWPARHAQLAREDSAWCLNSVPDETMLNKFPGCLPCRTVSMTS